MNTILKKLTIILIVLLIAVISFGGIYVKKLNKMENIIPSYLLGTDFKGKRVLLFKVSETQEEVASEENADAEAQEEVTGTENAGDEIQEETSENAKEEILTKENYEKVKAIFQERLATVKAEEYYIRTNTETGDIVVEVPENEKTESLYTLLASKGNFSIVDQETEEVLIDGTHVKNTQLLSNTTTTGTTLYLQINFDKDGTEKLKEISNTYIEHVSSEEDNTDENAAGETENTTDENGQTEDNTVDNTNTENTDTESVDTERTDTEDSSTEESNAEESNAEEPDISYVSIKLDDTTLTTTYFGEEIATGILQLPLAQNITDSETFSQYYESLSMVSNIINSGELPISYELANDNYIKSEIDTEVLKVAIYGCLVILVIAAMVLIIKYRVSGLFATILEIGYIAALLLIIRYANVALNIGGMIAVLAGAILNYVFLVKYLNKRKQNEKTAFGDTMKEYFIMLIPVCVIAIVFTFISALNISTIGMVLFWSVLLLALYNLIFTRTFYTNNAK